MRVAPAGRHPLRRLLAVAIATAGLLSAGCGGVSSASSGQISQDAKVVFRADLIPGSTGQTAARIAQEFMHVSGVWGTDGDSGQHVWIYSTRDVTPAQVRAIRQDLSRDPSVALWLPSRGLAERPIGCALPTGSPRGHAVIGCMPGSGRVRRAGHEMARSGVSNASRRDPASRPERRLSVRLSSGFQPRSVIDARPGLGLIEGSKS